jgi:hypothetical protein
MKEAENAKLDPLKPETRLKQRPDHRPMRAMVNYRTGSGSDLAVSVPFNLIQPHSTKRLSAVALFARLKIEFELKRSLSLSQRPGRYHHPKRAARLGTPVRFLFCS